MGTAPEQVQLSELVTAVFRAWQRAGIPFLVLRNYQGLPQIISNDIDVLVEPADLRRAEASLLAVAGAAGFRLVNRGEFATLALYLAAESSNAQAHFDLFTDLKWRGFDFLDCRGFLGCRIERGLFAIPHPAHEAATNLLAHFIFSGEIKEKYRADIAAGFQAAPDVATDLLAATYGHYHATALVADGAQGRWASIEQRAPSLRRSLILRQIAGHPARAARSFLRDGARLVRRLLRPPGLTVVLCGVDGSGKSTAARAAVEGLRGTFSLAKGRQFHWKPPIFSGRRQAARGLVADPHAQPPRSRLASLVFFGVHWLEFFLGWPLKIRPATFRGGLVLIDRYYFDFFIDQLRYRLRAPAALVRLGYRCLPKPDLVLLLDAPVDVLQGRKQEVSRAETQRQRDAYLDLVRNLPNGRVIDAAQPAEKVAAQIVGVALDFMSERAARRRGGSGRGERAR